MSSKRVVITGGPGFGKTSIIDELEARKFNCFHEVSRTIIKEQLATGGEILPWKNLVSFSHILLESRIQQFHKAQSSGFNFFDRALPDIIAYMQKDQLEIPNHYLDQLKNCTYFSTVFIVPPWKEIYKNDAQRMEDYTTAAQLHDFISETYHGLGYNIVVLPKVSVKERADFILNTLIENGN